jgi:acyl-CoA reductase-like NAD-dependent aldehyde dehydrogenase
VRTESVRLQDFIDGQFVDPVGGKYLDNVEQATGKPYSQVADSDARDVDLAVAAAEEAFADCSKKPAAERSKILLRIGDLIERDRAWAACPARMGSQAGPALVEED